MWKLTLEVGNSPLVTDNDGSLTSGALKMYYETILNWLDVNGQLPKKPNDIDTKEWFDKHFPEELAKIIIKEAAPLNRTVDATGREIVSQNKKTAGSITVALFDREASTLLGSLNLTGTLSKISPNRHARRATQALERRLAKHSKKEEENAN